MGSAFLIAVFIQFFINVAQQMSNGTMALYIDSIGGYAGFTGLMAAVFAVASISFRVISGKLFDRIGGKIIIIVGGIIYSVASIMYPILSVLWATLFLRFLQGVGFSAIGTSANAIAAKVTPPSRIGEGMSYLGVMAALGTAIGPTLGVFIWRQKGSPAIFIALASVSLIITLIAVFCNYEKKLLPHAATTTPLEAPATPSRFQIDKSQLKATVVTLLIAIPQAFVLTYIMLYGDSKNCAAADYFFAISAAAMMASRVLFGKSYDRHGAVQTLLPAIAGAIISMVLLCYLPTSFGVVLAAILYGFGYGVATPVLTAECVRLAPNDKKGSAVAVYYVGYDLGIGIGSLFWGVLIDHFGYIAVFWTSIILLLFATFAGLKLGDAKSAHL